MLTNYVGEKHERQRYQKNYRQYCMVDTKIENFEILLEIFWKVLG